MSQDERHLYKVEEMYVEEGQRRDKGLFFNFVTSCLLLKEGDEFNNLGKAEIIADNGSCMHVDLQDGRWTGRYRVIRPSFHK